MTQIVVFLQTKGGAGKTMNVVGLACRMALDGASVGVVDSDPNKGATEFFNRSDYDVACDYIGDASVFESAINQFKESGEYDIVFVDTAGARTLLHEHAMAASDLIIIPVKTEADDCDRALETYGHVKNASAEFGRELKTRFLFCDVDKGTRIAQMMSDWAKSEELPFFSNSIGHATGFKEMKTMGYLPESGTPARREIESFLSELQRGEYLEFYNSKYGRLI